MTPDDAIDGIHIAPTTLTQARNQLLEHCHGDHAAAAAAWKTRPAGLRAGPEIDPDQLAAWIATLPTDQQRRIADAARDDR